jgi:myo-inositol-1(or 4)-monophosphatase
MKLDLAFVCEQTVFAVREAAAFLAGHFGALREGQVESKGLHNYVTFVDKRSEEILVEALRRILPEADFHTEEGTVEEAMDGLRWIVDPLDGTTNYIHGVPMHCISVALCDGAETLAGVVYEAGMKECFYAWKGGGAWLNGKPIKVSEAPDLAHSLLATGFPYYDYSRLEAYLHLFGEFMKTTRGVRRLGSAAADLAYVACGRYDGFYEYGLQPWDVAAGALLVTEAGGKVFDFRGGKEYLYGKEIVASNSLISAEFLEQLQDL